MNDSGAASIFPDDLETLEAAGELLFRYHEHQAGIRLLAIALRLRGQTGIRPGVSERPPRPRSVSFACSADDIDESAGMAEVVELSAYSKRVPCA